MNEAKKKAIDGALDLIKQLITLSSSIIALTVTFIKDILGIVNGKNASLPDPHWTLYATWLCMLLSIFLGLLAHGAIVGMVDGLKPDEEPSVYRRPIKGLTMFQWLSFFTGVLMLIIFGWVTLGSRQ